MISYKVFSSYKFTRKQRKAVYSFSMFHFICVSLLFESLEDIKIEIDVVELTIAGISHFCSKP